MSGAGASEPPLGPGPFVISVQSQVAHGAVGNSAALFPMQALGARVAAVPTVLLSNHPRYPSARGRVLDPQLVADLLRGLEERGLVEAARVLLTGYLGSAEIGAVVADFVERARERNPALLYLCDPVIGDDGPGVFVDGRLVELFRRRLVPLCGLATPNQFELEILADAPARTLADAERAAARVMAQGPDRLVVTGAALAQTPQGEIETIVFGAGEALRVRTPRLPLRPNGAGDLFAGLLAARLARGEPLAEAARLSALGVSRALARSLAENAYELRFDLSDLSPA
ncbi:pyridoxal kinase [Methylocella sp.]|uniref:pyridoxal kinase n=1 Tax=Methylocella sp. TaxID=1978226 RepID=UPI0037834492